MDPQGARLLTYSTIEPTVSPACRLCINIHHYAPPGVAAHRAAGLLRWPLGYTHCAGVPL